MYLVSLVRNWLESLPGFIGVVAQTLTLTRDSQRSTPRSMEEQVI